MNLQPLLLDIQHIQRRMSAVQLDIAHYGVTLRLADFATLLMLFVFLVGFYVSDPFHIASFIAQRFGANGTVELSVYALLLIMAGLMAVTIARLKRAHYEHKAKYRYSGSVWKVGIVIMAFTVFAEIYNATGNQQHSQFATAESSKAFAALTQAPVLGAVNALPDISQIAYLHGELAKHREYLATCKKTCQAQRVRIAELEAEIQARENAHAKATKHSEQANRDAGNALANQLRQLREDYLHPMVKAMTALGLPASVAMQLIAALVAIAFERMHLSASENLRDCYSLLDGLEQHLLNKRKEYASFTGADYPSTDSDSSTELTPAVAATDLGDVSSDSSPSALFKWQQPTVKRFPGFVDTDKRELHAPHARVGDEIDQQASPPASTPLHARVGDFEGGNDDVLQTVTDAPIGSMVVCPYCGTEFTKRNQQHTFCCKEHRFAWHNERDPKRQQFLRGRGKQP